MKYFLSVLLLICLSLNSGAQEIPEVYAKAMSSFNEGDYNQAALLFSEFTKYIHVENEFTVAARYYLAESYLRIKQPEGAIPVLENFVYTFTWSGFHDDALYKLGTLYFDRKEFENCREKLTLLVDTYPSSEYVGSSLYFIGESYTRENNFEEAIRFFENAISSKKNNKYIDHSIYALANIYEEQGNDKKAVEYYDQLLAYHKNSPLAPNAQVRIGLSYFNIKDYDNAVLELSDPIINDLPVKEYTEAKYILANSFYRLREFDQAEKIFGELIKKNPASPLIRDIRYGLAWTYFQKNDYDRAFDIFNLLSKGKDTIAVNSFYWSAEAKRYGGNTAEANLIYEEFLQKFPDSPLTGNVQFQLGVTSYTKKKVNQSEEYLLSSAESKDDFTRAKAFVLLGELKLNKKDYVKSRNYFEKANGIENVLPELSSRALFGLAVTQYYLNQSDNAIQNLLELQRKSPSFETDKVNFYLGESYLSKKDFAKALAHFNKVTNQDADIKQQLNYSKGYAYYNLRDFVNASYSFNEFIKNNRGSKHVTDARLRLADSYYGEKQYTKASQIYKEVFLNENSSGTSDYAYYQYAQALYRAGNTDEAIKEFRNLQNRFPSSKYVAESQYIIGWIHFQKGRFNEAISNFHGVMSNYPGSPVIPVALNSIGNSYFNLGRYDSAYTYYDKVLNEYPGSNFVFEAISGMTDAFIAQDNSNQAVILIDNYLIRNPNISFADELAFKKGEIYYSIRQYEAAKNSYKDFISRYRSSPLISEAHYWVGKCASLLGQFEEALYNYNIVVSSHLESEVGVSAVLEMGRIHTDMKNYDAAIHIYDAAADKIPTSPQVAEIVYNKALVQIEKGDIPQAYESFNQVIQYYDGTIFAANSKFELGLLELARKNYETADMLFRELAENRIDDIGAKAQYHYGLSLFEQNKIDDAITAFVRVRFVFSAYDEWLTRSFLKLGECYEKKNDPQKAKEMYRTVLNRHKGDSYGTEAQNRLRSLQ